MKRPRKGGLRGELRIQRNLRERQFARRQFRHRLLQPHAAYVAVRRDARGKGKLARKMKRAVPGHCREIRQTEIVPDVCRDVVENAAQPDLIEAVRGGLGGRACAAVAMLVHQPGGKRQGGRLDVHPAGGRLHRKLGED